MTRSAPCAGAANAEKYHLDAGASHHGFSGRPPCSSAALFDDGDAKL